MIKSYFSPAFVATIEKYDLITAPYTTLTSLPDYVKKMSTTKQTAWKNIWNNAYRYMLAKTGDAKQAEKYAFRVANSRIRQVNDSSKGFFERLRDKITGK